MSRLWGWQIRARSRASASPWEKSQGKKRQAVHACARACADKLLGIPLALCAVVVLVNTL